MIKEHYEIMGERAVYMARRWVERLEAIKDTHWALAREMGAKGLRPSLYEGIKSLYFDKVPPGWKKIGYQDGLLECRPVLNTKAGKDAKKRLTSVETLPKWSALADLYGWEGREVMGEHEGSCTGFAIYRATGVRITRPRERFFLQLPRPDEGKEPDGWVCPEGLVKVRESDMMRAIEDHNELAALERKKAAEPQGARPQDRRDYQWRGGRGAIGFVM